LEHRGCHLCLDEGEEEKGSGTLPEEKALGEGDES